MKTTATILVVTIVASATLVVQSAPVAEQPKDTIVLDLGHGSFRAFEGWKTATLISPDGKLKPMLEPKRKDVKEEDRKPIPVRESSRPAANWVLPDFDGSVWPRVYGWVAFNNSGGVAYSPGSPIEGNLVCLRGKFTVTDLAQVTDLKLSVRYFGGALVYVNGTELRRGHLPAGKLEPDTMATSYPDEAYVSPDGKIRPFAVNQDPKIMAERLEGRQRELPAKGFADGVSIPASMLRKGVNVIAIEVRTAPVHESAVERSSVWPHAMVVDAKVTSSSGAGLIGNVAAWQGIQLANSQPIESIYAYEYTHPSKQIHPIRMIGARNGFFSGKVVLSSAEAIKNLKAAASDLVQAGGNGKIPAAKVQVRWAERTTPKVSWATHWADWGWVYFDRLLSDFPAQIAPAIRGLGRRGQSASNWAFRDLESDS